MTYLGRSSSGKKNLYAHSFLRNHTELYINGKFNKGSIRPKYNSLIFSSGKGKEPVNTIVKFLV